MILQSLVKYYENLEKQGLVSELGWCHAKVSYAEHDSIRFYYLGNHYQTKIEHFGVDRGTAADQVLIV